MPKKKKSVLEHLAEKVVVDDVTGCWVWYGAKRPDGYGSVTCTVNGLIARNAHRMTYMHFVGLVPDGLELDHLCRNRACCNPAHLEPVTHLENVRRSDNAGKAHNALKTHCKYGHPYDAENTGHDQLKNGKSHRRCKACDRQKKASISQEARISLNSRRKQAYAAKKKLMAERGFEIKEI